MSGSSPARQWEIVLAFCIVGGAATEGIQFLLGGDSSPGDLLRDVLGGVITLSWFALSSRGLAPRIRRGTRAVATTVLLVACLPLGVALSDEIIARLQFPCLSDFETPFETRRWDGNARCSTDSSVAWHGKSSLRVDMDTSLHSGVSLVYFPGDWRGYATLNLEALNPSSQPIDITCRIHDLRHEEGEQSYEDRFNKVFHLRSGWNHIVIDLKGVEQAPGGRTLDLSRIRAVGVFATGLPVPRTIFLDHLRLEDRRSR